MKKLYSAEVSGEFVFVVDLDKVEEDRAMDEAFQYLSNAKGIDLNLDNVSEIKTIDEIHPEFRYDKPFGANEKEDEDCESYFECRTEAKRITVGLEELGYELEETFAEDIRLLLRQEL